MDDVELPSEQGGDDVGPLQSAVSDGQAVSAMPSTNVGMPPHSTGDQMQQQSVPNPTTIQPPQPSLEIQTSQVERVECKIPVDVEFLVASGTVFTRHQTTLEPFDPLSLSKSPAARHELETPSPPTPLTARQLKELLKLLGPKTCLALPWLRLPFNPQKLIVGQAAALPSAVVPSSWSLQDTSTRSLMNHYKETQQLLSSHTEEANPTLYSNNYRRAPPVPIIKSHQGQLISSITVPDVNMNAYPNKLTNSLSTMILDVTAERNDNVCVPYFDPIKRVRDKMIAMERSLYGACLLDTQWYVKNDGSIRKKNECWRSKIQTATSIKKLSSLLVSLVDASCLRSFVPQWYKNDVKDQRDERDETLITVPDGWSPQRESTRRKWERSNENDVLRFLSHGELERIGLHKNKRGKLRKTIQDKVNDESAAPVAALLEDHDNNLTVAKLDQPKKPRSSYNCFKSAKHSEFKETQPGASWGDVNKLVNQAWKALSQSERAKWDELHEKDKVRYEKEMLAYSGFEVSNKWKWKQELPTLEDDEKPEDDGEANVAATPQANGGTTTTSSSPVSPSKRKCGQCTACLQEDCRLCAACVDMPRYGGPGNLQKGCIFKDTCLMIGALDSPPKAPPPQTPTKPKSSKEKKGKKRAKRESVSTPSSSRRRSDRLNVIRHQIETLLGINEETETDEIEREIIRLKLNKIQKLVSGDETTPYWAIAGNKLFEPSGSLCRQTVKWLGRNSGSVRAPSITYDTAFEVGETTVRHRWRKRTLANTTYEGLLYSLKVLDTHMDTSVTVSANSIADRMKYNKSTSVRCVHVDPATGFNEYFVVYSGRKRGSWYSEEKIDLTSLVQFRFEKRRPYMEQRQQLERKQLETSSSGTKRKIPSNGIQPTPPANKKAHHGTSSAIVKFQEALNNHRDDVCRLLKTSAAKGESSVPPSIMQETRNKNLSTMRAYNLLGMPESVLLTRIGEAEQEAIRLYIQQVQAIKANRMS